MTKFLILLKIISAVASKTPEAIKLLQMLYELFKPDLEPVLTDMALIAYTAEELDEMEKISQALSADGTQAVVDFSAIRALSKLFEKKGQHPILEALLKMLLGV